MLSNRMGKKGKKGKKYLPLDNWTGANNEKHNTKVSHERGEKQKKSDKERKKIDTEYQMSISFPFFSPFSTNLARPPPRKEPPGRVAAPRRGGLLSQGPNQQQWAAHLLPPVRPQTSPRRAAGPAHQGGHRAGHHRVGAHRGGGGSGTGAGDGPRGVPQRPPLPATGARRAGGRL